MNLTKAKFVNEAFEKKDSEITKRSLLFPAIGEIKFASDLLPGILRKKFTMSMLPPELIVKLYNDIKEDDFNLLFPRMSAKYESLNILIDGLGLLKNGISLMGDIFKKERWFYKKEFPTTLRSHNIQFVNTDGMIYVDIEPILCIHYNEDLIDNAWQKFIEEYSPDIKSKTSLVF